MDTIGMDLHKRESQLCILTDEGEVQEVRLVTSRARFTAVLGPRPRARVLLEASTESEWVAQHLESLGHDVIVADPNFAPMYATRTRRVKTDRRDARTLAEACRVGAYRPAHRLSARQRHIRAELAVREALVRTRTRFIALIRARVRSVGERLPSGMAEHTSAKLMALALECRTEELAAKFSQRQSKPLAPVEVNNAPVHDQVKTGDDVDLTKVPLLTHYDVNAAPYITAGIVVAADPDSGVRNTSYNRLMMARKRELRIFMAVGRHLWTLHNKMERRNKPLPIAVVRATPAMPAAMRFRAARLAALPAFEASVLTY